MTTCLGTPDSHCCNIGDLGVCGFFEPDDPSRPGQGSCQLRRRLGSWDKVHESDDYRPVGVIVRDMVGVDCGDWPTPGERCATCGVTGG